MHVYFETVLFKLIVLSLFIRINSSYKQSGANLKSFPLNIDNTSEIISLGDNSLISVDKGLVGKSQLKRLVLFSNYFSSFPNLTDVATTLTSLNLNNNVIEHINPLFLNELITLKTLVLGHNKIKVIPNVAGPADTLQILRVENNLVEVFPNLSTIGKSLQTVFLDDNFISKIPVENNLFMGVYVSTSLQILRIINNYLTTITIPIGPYLETYYFKINIAQNKINCDWNIGWLLRLKAIQLHGKCHQPSSLKDKLLHTLSIADLLNAKELEKPRSQSQVIKRLNAYSLVMPLEKRHTPSGVECAVLCMSTTGCLYFNYFHDYDRDTNCHIASPVNGIFYTSIPDGVNWGYYAVNP